MPISSCSSGPDLQILLRHNKSHGTLPLQSQLLQYCLLSEMWRREDERLKPGDGVAASKYIIWQIEAGDMISYEKKMVEFLLFQLLGERLQVPPRSNV